MSTTYPKIRIAGSPRDRGIQYGTLARTQIHRGRAGYERNFALSGITWQSATTYAQRYVESIEARYPEMLEEMHGIAEGAQLPFEDILAMNCRTEIMWRQVVSVGVTDGILGECSAIGVDGARSSDGHPVIAQNWDWLVHARDSIIVLEVEPADGLRFVTIVEAGLLAKISMNETGLSVAVNTLSTDADADTTGVPFHLLLRALTQQQTVYDCVSELAGVIRASSGNFLVGSPVGGVLNVECEPGGVAGVHAVPAPLGLTTHTNHFITSPRAIDLAPVTMPDSYVRHNRLNALLGKTQLISETDLQDALRDHIEQPSSVCCHPDVRDAEPKRWSTIASVVMRPQQRAILMAEGNPCMTPFSALDLNTFFEKVAGA